MAELALVASLVSAGGSVLGGISANKAGKYEAEQLKRAAAEERASGYREAQEKRREAAYVASTQRAKAAASGSSIAGSPTIVDIMGDTAQRGEYLAQVEAYGGESRARGRLDQAKAARFKGKSALAGSILDGISEVAMGGYKAYDAGLFGKKKSYG